jgi:predicted Rossmann fold flavoprotein
MEHFDVVVIGAGAAGLRCAIEAGRRGRKVLVLDHAAKPGEKIRISGGGRCNFTNVNIAPDRFLSSNPGFCISALRRRRPQDEMAWLRDAGIAFHEKTLGQLFCDDSAQQVVDLLVHDLKAAGGDLRLATMVDRVAKDGDGFRVAAGSDIACRSLVIATGGKSIPKMGATGFGYDIARQFGVPVTDTRPGLVPLTFETGLLQRTAPLSGVSAEAVVQAGKTRFREALLFTHRGLSGPAILQASSYWREGEAVTVNLAPDVDLFAQLRAARQTHGKQAPATLLAQHLPQRLARWIVEEQAVTGNVADLNDGRLKALAAAANAWSVKPVGSEGYRSAEVTLGGVDTRALDQRTMAVTAVPGLHFIGEVVDVTGWLGGYNFQWAWSSGWCAGQAV